MPPQIETAQVPADGLATAALGRIDYADAFRISVACGRSLDDVVQSAFLTAPPWIDRLLRLRNTLVRPLGLKTEFDPSALQPRTEIQVGERVGIFRVFARTPGEILMGDDDRHLNFRVSARMDEKDGQCWFTVTTLVQYNNLLGRLYFLPVRPFHRLIVPAMLRQVAVSPQG